MRRPHSRCSASEPEHLLGEPAVRPVDQLVQVDERLGAREVPVLERAQGDAGHLLGADAHLGEGGDDPRLARGDAGQLRQLCDRDAVVGHPLEVEVDVQHRQHEPKVGRDRRLPGEQRLDPLLDREVGVVDLVVEGDHLVGQLEVLLDERLRRRLHRSHDELALLLERRLEVGELLVEGDPEPAALDRRPGRQLMRSAAVAATLRAGQAGPARRP